MKFNYRFSNLCGSVYTGGNTVFTPDGRSVISPVSNRVTVFDLVNHRTSTLAFSLTSTVNCLTLSPDGRLLIAIADDGRAIAYHFEHGTVLFDFNLGGRCEVAKFSLDGRYVAFALDRRIEVYHSPPLIASHRPMQKHLSFHSHHETVRCLEWSSSSNNQSVYLLSGSDDGTARIHSVGADEGDQSFVPLSLTGHRGAVVGAFWGGECSETDNQSISVYTVSSDGQFLHWRWQPRDEDEEPAGKPVNKKSITKVLASRSQTSLSLFGIPGRFSLSTKHFFNANTGGSTVTCATLHSSPQSVNNSIDLLIVAFSTGVFSLYEVPSFTLIHSLSVSASPLSSVSVSPDGAWLSLGSSALGSLCVWEWQSESYLLKQQGHSALITCLAYSSDGQFVVTGGEDGRVKLWNAATGFCFKTFSDHTAPVTSVAVSEVGAVVVSCSLDGTAHAYDLTRYRLFRTLKPEFPVQYTHMCLDPSGELVICVSNDPFELHVYSLETGKLIDSLGGHTAPISAISYSSSLSLLFTSSWDKTVKVWDVFNGRGCVDTFSHAHEVLSVAVSPRGDQLVSATLNGDLSIWSISEASIIGTIEARRDLQHGRLRDQARSSKTSAHSSYVTSMCYSADGSSLLTGGNTRYVCIYDMASRLLLNKFTVATSERLDGGKDKLNSRYMEANLAGTSMDNERDNSLPGVRTGERSDRKFTQSVRTRCVRFAPSGSQWACATPEGLLIYALDQDATFDPIDLGQFSLFIISSIIYSCYFRIDDMTETEFLVLQ